METVCRNVKRWQGDDHVGWDGNNSTLANADLEPRREVIRKAYDRDLDTLLDPIAHWPAVTQVAQSTDASGRPLDPRQTTDTAPVPTDRATPVDPSKRSDLAPARPQQ